MTTLTERQTEILRSLRDKSSPRDADILKQVMGDEIGSEEIQRDCDLINDEYLIKGIEKDYYSNEYGRKLNELINRVNEPRLS